MRSIAIYNTFIVLLSVFSIANKADAQIILGSASVITPANYTERYADVYLYRKALKDSLQANKRRAVIWLRGIKVVDTIGKQQKHDTAGILTNREQILIHYWLGEYDSILRGIYGNNYFTSSWWKHRAKYGYERLDVPLGMPDYWTGQKDIIINAINQSSVSSEQKDFLIAYWKCIMIYIKTDNALDTNIRNIAVEYISKYPNSQYDTALKGRLVNVKKVYKISSFTMDLNVYQPLMIGKATNYLAGNLSVQFGGELEIKNWSIFGCVNQADFAVKDTIRSIGNNSVGKTNLMQSSGTLFGIGYAAVNTPRYRLKPLIGLYFYRFASFEGATSINTGTQTAISLIYPDIYIGAENYIFFKKTPQLRSKADTNNNVKDDNRLFKIGYLKITLGFYPGYIAGATSVNGSAFVISFGIGFGGGVNQAYYKFNRFEIKSLQNQ